MSHSSPALIWLPHPAPSPKASIILHHKPFLPSLTFTRTQFWTGFLAYLPSSIICTQFWTGFLPCAPPPPPLSYLFALNFVLDSAVRPPFCIRLHSVLDWISTLLNGNIVLREREQKRFRKKHKWNITIIVWLQLEILWPRALF